MKSLLDGRMAPLTYSWGFLETDLEILKASLKRWSRISYRPSLPCAIREIPVPADLAESLRLLEPLTPTGARELWLETASGWIGGFDNGLRGDPPIEYLSKTVGCRGIKVSSCPNAYDAETNKGTYGGVAFSVYSPAARPGQIHNCERSVHAVNDAGRWRFEAFGDVQPYEEIEQYKARRVRDRFTPEMLERYCAAIGIRLFDPDFYCGPRALIVKAGWVRNPLTFNEARAKLGLPPVEWSATDLKGRGDESPP